MAEWGAVNGVNLSYGFSG